MNNEQYNQIIDEAYENYQNYPLATIHDHRINLLYQNRGKGWCMLNGRSMTSPHPTRHLTKEEFINKCKTDPEFSERWGLKIEERELSLEERHQISISRIGQDGIADRDNITWHETYNKTGIPTKLITITYNNETIESYE
jgi:hypothetical protein